MALHPPVAAFDAEPRTCVTLNNDWISHVIGLIDRASKEYYWSSDAYEATQEIEKIIRAFVFGNCEPSMIGTVHAYAGESLPSGALWCDGESYSRDDYPALYDVLGEVYQTDAENFTVPDLRAKFVVGVNEDDLGEDVSNYGLGDTGGAEKVVLSGFQVGVHQHGIAPHNHPYDRARNTGLEAQEYATGTPVPVPSIDSSANTGMASIATDDYPIETVEHENRPPFVALRYFIVAR